MNVLDIILEANKGLLVTSLAAAGAVSVDDTRAAFEILVPEIAGKIRAKAESDEDEYEHLMDVVDDREQEQYLDKPKWSLSRGAVEDGEEILGYLYGSLEAARARAAQLNSIDGIDDEFFGRLMTFAATYTVAAMARKNAQLMMAAADMPGERPGWLALLVEALLKGIMQALVRRTRPRRRRRRYGRRRVSARTRRRRTRRRRRRRPPSLNDLIGDLFRG